MDNANKIPTSTTDNQLPIDTAQPPEALRRDFLKRFGGYAATTPLLAFTLFSSQSSKAAGSGVNNDGGGD